VAVMKEEVSVQADTSSSEMQQIGFIFQQ